MKNAFAEWWDKDGRYIDPDTSDVPWFDKRKELAAIAFKSGLETSAEYYEAILAMTVGRLEGTVEGHPTSRINFLQRIDELRRIEKSASALLATVKQFDTLVRKLEGTEIEYGLAIALGEVLLNSHEAIIEAVGVEAAMDFIDEAAQ